MPYDNRIPSRLQLLRVGLDGRDDLGVFTYTTTSEYMSPSYCLGSATDDPDTMDIAGTIEETLHDLLDNGGTPEDVRRIMGLVPSQSLETDTVASGDYTDIDLGWCIDGQLQSFEKLPTALSSVEDIFTEQQIANIVMAFENLSDPDLRLEAAERIAAQGFTGWQAQEVLHAVQQRLPSEVIDAIADPHLSHSQMRELCGIARLTEPSPTVSGETVRPAFDAALARVDEIGDNLLVLRYLAEVANVNDVPFDPRWTALDGYQMHAMTSAIGNKVHEQLLKAFADGEYPGLSMEVISHICIRNGGRPINDRILNPAYDTAQLWCLCSAQQSHMDGLLSDAQFDFLCNPELPAPLMNAVRTGFTYGGLSEMTARDNITPGTAPEEVFDLTRADDRPVEETPQSEAAEDHGRADGTGDLHSAARESRVASGKLAEGLEDHDAMEHGEK